MLILLQPLAMLEPDCSRFWSKAMHWASTSLLMVRWVLPMVLKGLAQSGGLSNRHKLSASVQPGQFLMLPFVLR